MPPKAPGRRGSTNVKKFMGDALVEGVIHTASGRTFQNQAEYDAFEAAGGETAAVVREQEEAAALAKKQEQQTAEAEAEAEAEEAARVAEEKARKEALRQEAVLTAQRQAAEEEAAEMAAAAKAAKKAAKKAEKERLVTQEAQEQQNKEAAAAAENEAEEEREAQDALNARIAEEKARREAAQKAEAEAARKQAEEERLAAQYEAEATAQAARAALAASNEEDSAELTEKKRLAEERRRKQAAFLDGMDSFSNDFMTHSAKVDKQKQEQLSKTQSILDASVNTQAEGFVPVAANYVPAVPTERASLVAREEYVSYKAQPPAAVAEDDDTNKDKEIDTGAVKFGGGNSDTFHQSSLALFNSKEEVSSGADAVAAGAASSSSSLDLDDAPLRMPTRVGKNGLSKKNSVAAPLVENSSVALKPSLPVGRIGADRVEAVVPSLDKYNSQTTQSKAKSSGTTEGVDDDEYNEEEGFGVDNSISNVLTREERQSLTPAQKVEWRAKQEHLGKRRRGFHGAVTYAFNGIFSWQMYGSAEAVDEGGNTYTEYLMRCQWGTSWDNLQPWISARRYREFDTLDYDLRRAFPNYERAMPQLPGKDLFRSLESDVIDKRRQTLENYMARIVLHLPTILRSKILSDFLGIQERMVTIKKQLASGTPSVSMTWTQQTEESASAAATVAPTPQASSTPAVESAPKFDAASDHSVMSSQPDALLVNEDDFIGSVADAETQRKLLDCPPLTEDELSHFEEELKKLIIGLDAHSSQKKIKKTSAGYRNLIKLTKEWPALRATCQVDGNHALSYTLIPRGMQAEEDLVKLIKDFESVMAISDHLAVLGI